MDVKDDSSTPGTPTITAAIAIPIGVDLVVDVDVDVDAVDDDNVDGGTGAGFGVGVAAGTGAGVHRVEPSNQRQGGESQMSRLRRSCDRFSSIGLLFVVAVFVAMIVLEPIRSSSDHIDDELRATPIPSTFPTAAPTNKDWVELLSLIRSALDDDEYFQKVFVDDPNSPQYQAAMWMTNEDTFRRGNESSAEAETEAEGYYYSLLLQRFALATLYFATGGDEWSGCNRLDPICTTQEAGWLSPVDECAWRAISCDDSFTVVRMAFFQQASYRIILSGTLPSELSFLTALESMTLRDHHDLAGSIPESLAKLPLRRLAISHTQISGSLPAGLLSKLSLLTSLDLENNMLSGTLHLDEINWTNLTEFDVSSNSFEGNIPINVGQGELLQVFNIEQNNFAGTMPTEIFNLSQLTVLRLGDNPWLVGEIDPAYGTFHSLQELNLGGMSMTGTIPEELFDLIGLKKLQLHSSGLHGTLSESFINLHQLDELHLQNNSFVGPIPAAFDSLVNLETLQLHHNQLVGNISDAICARRPTCVKITILSADCESLNASTPARVSCKCCNFCYANP